MSSEKPLRTGDPQRPIRKQELVNAVAALLAERQYSSLLVTQEQIAVRLNQLLDLYKV